MPITNGGIGMLKKICLIIFIIMLMCSSVNALTLKKEALQTINLGETLTVTIFVTNTESITVNAYIRETILNADPVEPSEFEQIKETNVIAALPPFYSWEFEMKPLETKNINYKVRPKMVGDFYLSRTEAMIEDSEQTFYSNDLTVKVISQNGVCEPELGENYLTNPPDCPTGSKDGLCDLKRDGKCDPDCLEGADSDCSCGDDICQVYEDKEICSLDCKCGNDICDDNENLSSCPKDCHCGDSICDPDESTETCSLDCPEQRKSNHLAYILGFLIISVLTAGAVVFLMFRNKKNKDPILTWIKKAKSKGLSDETIKDLLIKKGHKEENISKYFK